MASESLMNRSLLNFFFFYSTSGTVPPYRTVRHIAVQMRGAFSSAQGASRLLFHEKQFQLGLLTPPTSFFVKVHSISKQYLTVFEIYSFKKLEKVRIT